MPLHLTGTRHKLQLCHQTSRAALLNSWHLNSGRSKIRLCPEDVLGAICITHRISFACGSGLYLLFITSVRKAKKSREEKKKWQIIEVAFCFLPVHLSCFQLLGFSFALKFYCDRELPTGCSVLCAIFEAFLTSMQ